MNCVLKKWKLGNHDGGINKKEFGHNNVTTNFWFKT